MQKNKAIKSFILRGGRISARQKLALDLLWPKFGVITIQDKQLDFKELFNKSSPQVVLEIGFGNGTSLAAIAAKNPDISFLGIEVYKAGVGNLLELIEADNLNNIRIIQHDAVEILGNHIKDHSLHKVQIFFPDPWPKLRHHKRRLINPLFVDLLASKIMPGGILHMATDWENYAMQMLEVASTSSYFTNSYGADNFASDKLGRIETKFERRGARLGHPVRDLVFKR